MSDPLTRRGFLRYSGVALASTPLLAAEAARPVDASKMSVQEAIDRITEWSGAGPIKDTVDTVKAGDPQRPLGGIATTFLATREVIQKVGRTKANLLITHEPTYYNHFDATGALKDDPVYRDKRALLEKTGIVVWRFHDYWHHTRPDGIETGVLRQLGWESYVTAEDPYVCTIPVRPLRNLVDELKRKMALPFVRVIGARDMPCRRVALQPGAWGGERQIRALGRPDVDVLVCGEISEWETSEYVRDAVDAGMHKALVICGHQPSEEAGMQYLAEWLRARLGGVPITHVSARSPFWTA